VILEIVTGDAILDDIHVEFNEKSGTGDREVLLAPDAQ
jgi:hypothetical protein